MITDQELYGARILVVDDEPLLTLLLERTLQREGYQEVLCTNDPREAADLFLAFDPDLLILDLNMPGVSGFDVMDRLAELDPHNGLVPILVLTGDDNREARLRALRAGARDFLAKPPDLEVAARVRNLLEVRLVHRRTLDHNRLLEEAVALRTRELREAHLETVRRLAMAAEFRDDDTGTHIQRMSLYCALLARSIGLPEERTEVLYHASALHDIGKIAIPDSILLKKGKLTPEEWEVMKTHAQMGARMLGQGRSEILRAAEAIARTHHERWDGSGYPAGLKAEQIPREGRIVAVCDVFDALTSERPYKRAWSTQEAVAEIRRGAGAHFDPEMADAFERILPEVLGVRERFARGQCLEWPLGAEVVRPSPGQCLARGTGECDGAALRSIPCV